MKPQKPQPPFGLRLPPDLKDWLTVKAREHHRSLNGELVHVLERYRAEQQKEAHAAEHA